MPVFECKNCIPTNVPESWTDEKKNEVASLVRKFGRLASVQLFQPIEMKLIDAKGIAAHITLKKGFCVCGTKLTEYEGKCLKCERLNLDW